jgi:outer membrane protein OmpA-like peptidoglycan-associated protein
MRFISKKQGLRVLLVALTVSASGAGFAQQQAPSDDGVVVNGVKTAGPEIKGVIVARNDDRMKIATADGTSRIVAVDDATKIRAGGGLFGAHDKMAEDALLNGLPVTVKTWQSGNGSDGELVASRISFRNSDFRTASMIRNGTSQRFDEQTAATENLRAHLGDIDKYNVKSTTEVHFDTGKANLSDEDKAQLCATANTANAMENALLLVVGYTDSTGGDDFNQQLSEKRAGRVINYLQQACGWKPYRMLTPTGMSKADPVASNDTPEGKAENRRVAVNVMVSKTVDGL